MIVGAVIEMSVGLLCVVFGLLLWLKQKVSLLHTYHYKNVKEEHIPAFSRQMGIGLISIGLGICITGLLNVFRSGFWWIPMTVGIVVGAIVMHRAEKRYNGSWFG